MGLVNETDRRVSMSTPGCGDEDCRCGKVTPLTIGLARSTTVPEGVGFLAGGAGCLLTDSSVECCVFAGGPSDLRFGGGLGLLVSCSVGIIARTWRELMKPMCAPGGTLVMRLLLGRFPGPPKVGFWVTVVVFPIWVVVVWEEAVVWGRHSRLWDGLLFPKDWLRASPFVGFSTQSSSWMDGLLLIELYGGGYSALHIFSMCSFGGGVRPRTLAMLATSISPPRVANNCWIFLFSRNSDGLRGS